MIRTKKLKFYFYHGKYLYASPNREKLKRGGFSKIGRGVFWFFYFIGNLLVQTVLLPYRFIKNQILQTAHFGRLRWRRLSQAHYAKTLFIFLIIAALGWAAITVLNLTAQGLALKDKILRYTFFGQNYLSEAKDALITKNFNQAENRLALAYQTFERGQSQLEEGGQALNQLLNFVPQKRDAERLLEAARQTAAAGVYAIQLQKNLQSLKFTSAGLNDQDGQIAAIFESTQTNLKPALQRISEAYDLVSQVSEKNLPAENRPTLRDAKEKLFQAKLALANFSSIISLAKGFLLGNKNILVLLENNNELRPAGGFPGTYALLKIHNGSLRQITVSSIYDLDGQLKEIIKPPFPVLNVNDRWFLRDANWFASWPASAKIISNFYEKEGGNTPDILLALTPDTIIDWLKILGPLYLPKYDVTLSADNFIEKTQVLTATNDSLPTNEPKQILADLLPLLLQKISAADGDTWQKIIQGLEDNLNSRQIVIYSNDSGLQNQLENFHWAGKLEATDRDFLSVVNTNLGGTKTDLSIEQTINLITTIDPDGSLINHLQITRTNRLPDLPKAENIAFVRIYVPAESRLINNSGFDYKNLDFAPDKKYKTLDEVEIWQKNLLKDVDTGTVIGKESGKTFFGNWLELAGGQSKTINLTYRLPFNLKDTDRYSLLLQKQIGSLPANFSWTLNIAGRKVEWKNFDAHQDTDLLTSDILLDKDYFLGAVLQKE